MTPLDVIMVTESLQVGDMINFKTVNNKCHIFPPCLHSYFVVLLKG